MAGESATPVGGHVFGPRETRGLLIGLRGSQLAAVMIGLGAFVVGLSLGPVGATTGTMALAVAATGAFAPIAGRTPEQWAPVVLGFLMKRLMRRHVYSRRLTAAPDLPSHLAGMRIVAIPTTDGQTVGVIQDSARGTLAAVMSVSGETFMLLDREEQERRSNAWGALLAGLARDGSPVVRVQWVARTVPETGQALRHFWERAGTRGSAPAISYQQLQSSAGARGWRTETYLTIVIAVRKARSRDRSADALPAGGELLMRELAGVEGRLAQCDLLVSGWLPPRGLAKVLREGYELGARTAIEGRGSAVPGPGVDAAVAGPMLARDSWATYRTDDAWHATYWIHEWPRLGVGSDFLAPLLTEGGTRRTLAVVAEPVSARSAARQIAAARTADVANQAMRERVGQMTTERNRSEAEEVERRERELVAGHADYRFTGLLTVTAETPETLDEACLQAEIAAHACCLELRRLYGEQDQAFAASLPLGRAVR